MRYFLTLLFASLLVAGCGRDDAASETPAAATPEAETAAAPAMERESDAERLGRILDAQPDDVKARYPHRNPQETLEFFGIEPGMTVVEALPGRGWYTKILLPYLGTDGTLIGVDYSREMWPNFPFMTPERLKAKETWAADWTEEAEAWRSANSASVSAYAIDEIPESLNGTVDAVLFIRALHNMHRFEGEGGYFSAALERAYELLKPGGIVGVVQHEARDDKPDEWADGSRGYMKQTRIAEAFSDVGFELVATSNINRNDKDQPGEEDIVWRLPPSLVTSQEDPELKASLEAIGESNRMTLKFRKPE